MQVGILVKNGTSTVEKNVYAGNTSDSRMESEIFRLQAKYPTYTVTFYASDQDPEFQAA